MTSANSEIANRKVKIHNDMYPRRLRLKLSHRRRLIGESASLPRAGTRMGPAGVAIGVSGALSAVRASTSDLPAFEIDARIDQRICEIGDQVHDQADQGEYVEIGEDYRII